MSKRRQKLLKKIIFITNTKDQGRVSLCGQGRQFGRSVWCWCTCCVGWPRSLVVSLTACPFAGTAYSVTCSVLKSRCGGSWLVVFSYFILANFILCFIFFLGGLFYELDVINRALAQRAMFFFFFCFLSIHILPKCTVNQKEI